MAFKSIRQFIYFVVLPLALVAMVVATLAFSLIGRVSESANREDHLRTQQVLNSAILSTRRQLESNVADNALWDDGAVHVYERVADQEYFENTWGATTKDGNLYDTVLVIDSNLSLVSGFINGKLVQIDPDKYFGPAFKNFVAKVNKDRVDSVVASDLFQTPDGIAIVAIGNVVPITEGLALEMPGVRMLVMARFLNDNLVAEISERFVVKDLKFRAGTVNEKYLTVASEQGEKLGSFTWLRRKPGDKARAEILPMATLLQMVLMASLGLLALFCLRQFRQILTREEEAQFNAVHDLLTGLPNRAGIEIGIRQALVDPAVPVAVLFADLDGFKFVNDSYGHETGDELLKCVSGGFRVLFRDCAQFGRLGGDEFIAVFRGPDAMAKAEESAQHILAFLKEPFVIGERHVHVGASIGVALSSPAMSGHVELMRRADLAMYNAKAKGRNCCVAYDATIDAKRAEADEIAEALRKIIANKKIDVAYQPVIRADTGDIAGVEVLARWPSEILPSYGPDRFIAVAENTGIIHELGYQVLARACADALMWPGLKLAVNVSPLQLHDPNFAKRVLAIIDGVGMPRSRVELELTECQLVEDKAAAQVILSTLQKAGISIALDDFGSGYASIAYVRELAFNRIKIDRSLISPLTSSPMAQRLVQAVSLIANSIGAKLTAEGVENEETAQFARLAGCDLLQGQHISMPVPAADISRMLHQNRSFLAQNSA